MQPLTLPQNEEIPINTYPVHYILNLSGSRLPQKQIQTSLKEKRGERKKEKGKMAMDLSFSVLVLLVFCVSSSVTEAQVLDVTKYGAKGDGSSDIAQVRGSSSSLGFRVWMGILTALTFLVFFSFFDVLNY